MVNKRKSRKTTVKRTHKKKRVVRKNQRKVQTLHWRNQPFPWQLATEFTYGENNVIASTSGAVTTLTINANGMYDPDQTSTGHQPRWYDTLLGPDTSHQPYRNYTVYASKVRAVIMATGSDSVSQRAYVYLGPANANVNPPGSLQQMLERREGKNKYLGYWSGGTDKVVISQYSKIAPILGRKDLEDDEECSGAYNSLPANKAYWYLSIVPVDETSSYSYRIMWTITYYCKLYTLNDAADS